MVYLYKLAVVKQFYDDDDDDDDDTQILYLDFIWRCGLAVKALV